MTKINSELALAKIDNKFWLKPIWLFFLNGLKPFPIDIYGFISSCSTLKIPANLTGFWNSLSFVYYESLSIAPIERPVWALFESFSGGNADAETLKKASSESGK